MEVVENLPEEIIHRIQSFLEAKEAAKTGVLSKLWLRAWRTQPILQCDLNCFSKNRSKNDFGNCGDRFENYVYDSLARYQREKITIDKLKLISIFNPECDEYGWTSRMNRLIKIAIETGLKKVELVHVPTRSSIPPILFESELLEDISISYHPSDRNLLVSKKISCFRLKRLSLCRMYFEDGTLEKILCVCQCIEFLNLCEIFVKRGKSELKVVLRNLKELHIQSLLCNTLEVEAPNLEVFTYSRSGGSNHKPCWIDLKTTQNLMFLKLFRARLYWEKLFGRNKFPKLETLIIKDCPSLPVQITSELEYLLVVNGLNSIRFDYSCCIDFIPIVSLTNLSKHSVSNINLDVLDPRRFCRLKDSLKKLMSSRISLSIKGIIKAECFRFEEGYNKLPIPVHELSLGEPSYAHGLTGLRYSKIFTVPTILDAIFWTCRPTLIKLGTSPSWYYSPDNSFTRFLVWKLLGGRDGESPEIKPWQRDLKEVKFCLFTRKEQNEYWKPDSSWEEWKTESWEWETFLDMTSKVEVLICVTCDWETPNC